MLTPIYLQLWNNGNETYVREIQGLNNWVLYLRSMGRRDNAYYSLDNGAYHRMNNGGRDKNHEVLTTTKNAYSYGLNSILTTNRADQINKGQISLYPYNTTSSDGTIKLATTHGQMILLYGIHCHQIDQITMVITKVMPQLTTTSTQRVTLPIRVQVTRIWVRPMNISFS